MPKGFGKEIEDTMNSLNFMKSFGPDGQFIIMPGLGISRTQYLKNNQNGRVDMVYFAGLSGIWQPLQWLSFQKFMEVKLIFLPNVNSCSQEEASKIEQLFKLSRMPIKMET